jgi:hypothetical protein
MADTNLQGRPLDRKAFKDAESCVATALRHFDPVRGKPCPSGRGRIARTA